MHDLHVWQLSESEVVTSVHVLATRPARSMPTTNELVEDERDDGIVHTHMSLSAKLRGAMYAHGIHSSTVQLEYVSEGSEVDDGKVVRCCFWDFAGDFSTPN